MELLGEVGADFEFFDEIERMFIVFGYWRMKIEFFGVAGVS